LKGVASSANEYVQRRKFGIRKIIHFPSVWPFNSAFVDTVSVGFMLPSKAGSTTIQVSDLLIFAGKKSHRPHATEEQ